MKRDKFQIPSSLEGKLFRAGEFFERKKRGEDTPFLTEQLSNCRRIQTGEGAYIHRRVSVPMDGKPDGDGYLFPWGGEDRKIDPDSLSLLAGEPGWSPSPGDRIVFLDLETTGLSGGTGTYPFLCGIGYFEGEAFIVEQFFMEDYPWERVMLEAVSEKIKEARILSSFNGKSFDVPLLATRFLYNRMRVKLELPHIDLLHPSRRIWRGVFPDCRLETIEREAFGLVRKKDVESSLIPQIYFNFVRGRHRDWMLPVFHHNVQDIVTLGSLLLFFCRILSDPDKGELKRPLEFWGLGRLFLKCGRIEQALRSHEHALSIARRPDTIESLLFHIGRLYKKLGRWEDAIPTWQRLVGLSETHRISSAVELAKYYEHKKREPEMAREIIIKAISSLEIRGELEGYLKGIPEGSSPAITPEIEHRLLRLEKKIQRTKQG